MWGSRVTSGVYLGTTVKEGERIGDMQPCAIVACLALGRSKSSSALQYGKEEVDIDNSMNSEAFGVKPN